jgi:hypothetical protein
VADEVRGVVTVVTVAVAAMAAGRVGTANLAAVLGQWMGVVPVQGNKRLAVCDSKDMVVA